jgi:hypothetical protein
MVVGARRHMPRRRSGHTTTVTIGAERFCLTANQRDDGSLGEVFIHWGKHGTSTAGLVSTYALALSAGLQHQVPLADLIRPGLDQFFAPHGHTDDPEIPRVRSAIDYIARRLAIDWLPYPERAALGVYTLTERVQRASTWIAAFALTMRLLPLVLAAQAPRVVTMSSGVASYGRIRFDDLQWQRGYRPNLAYAQSKLAAAARLRAEAERLTGTARPASAARG